MGAVCSCDDPTKIDEEVSADVVQQTKIVQERAADVADAAKKISEDVADKAAEAAQKKVADIAEATQEKAVEIAEAGQEAAAEVQEVVGVATKQSTEAVCATMDAAVAAVTGTMIVEFVAEKGEVKKVDFKTKKVGFEVAMSGGGCCGPAGQAQGAVKKIDTKGQAETLGVKLGWRVKSISGTEVSGLKPAHKLLEESVAKLSEA
mmetsp:Transcript_66075/g.214939  ORF Transcript_66075/g.214939 Transcript_66075/m.214939 type:complete len:205 (-) Transcript_66075:376-990(-)